MAFIKYELFVDNTFCMTVGKHCLQATIISALFPSLSFRHHTSALSDPTASNFHGQRFVASFLEQSTVFLFDTNAEIQLWSLRFKLLTEIETECISSLSCCCRLQQMTLHSISLASYRENFVHSQRPKFIF